MRLAALLRMTALGIAFMCWLDPASTIAPPPQVLVDAAIVHSTRDARKARDGSSLTILDLAKRTTEDLQRALGRAGAVRVHDVVEGAVLPCDATQPCLVLTDGAPVVVPPDRKGPLTVVRLGEPLTNNVEVRGLAAAPAHVEGQAVARVTLAGRGLTGRTTLVRVRDGGAIVGEAALTWSSDGEVAVDVPWWPVSGGTRHLVAQAQTEGGSDATAVDNDVAAAVEVAAGRWPVMVLERRPSWAATFIRRALEDDRRFELLARTDVAPGVSVASGANLFQQLDRARVVVAGAPEALTTEDVARLDAFVRRRGGAVVLAADRPFGGPVTRLLHHAWRERLDSAPTVAGPLRGTEWLVAAGVTPLDHVWAESAQGPTVVSTPAGPGVVLVSGALDAWRFRAEDGSFERFWQAAVAGLAGAVGDVVDLNVVRAAPQEGGALEAQVHARSLRETTAWQASAVRTCDDGDAVPIRLWPADAAGAFSGRVPVGTRSGCRVMATIVGVGEAMAMLSDGAPRASSQRWTQADMEAIAARTGGAVVTDEHVAPVVQAWLDARGPERRPETRHPMRSWWWLFPFAGCLAGEWWLRRRAGLR